MKLDKFLQTRGPEVDCIPASDEIVLQYQEKLPHILIDHWKKNGWCGYAKGFLWIVNPGDFDEVLSEWLEPEYERAIVFARTAFGCLYFWYQDHVYFLDVLYGTLEELTKKMEILFDFLFCDDEYLIDELNHETFLFSGC